MEVVEHVESVVVDGARSHRVVRESQRLSQLEDKPVEGLLIHSMQSPPSVVIASWVGSACCLPFKKLSKFHNLELQDIKF